ncbi:MAG: SGNH/GDSL hydrolase family protein [Eubacterium sp.]|nr:SGNH/GDSL hydrolase family protein [Eubacterium sp.]
MRILAAGVIVAAIIVIAVIVTGKKPDQESEAGREYLESLEVQSTSQAENEIREAKQAKIDANREQLISQLEDGTIDVWSQFDDYVVMGDSRAVGFSYFGFLPEDRVLAEGGATIRNIEGYMDTLKALNPTHIFLCYGLNDISIGFWQTADDYCAEYMSIIQDLKTQFPNATIYVNSAILAIDPAFAKAEIWRSIPDWNQVLKETCAANSVPFVDNQEICEEHSDLHDPDGIHVQREFYPYWAINMIMAQYGVENEEESDG